MEDQQTADAPESLGTLPNSRLFVELILGCSRDAA